jgi:transmembrane sensor
MKTNGFEATEFDDVELAAAEWFSRAEFGLNATETREFEQWKKANPRHAAIYREISATSQVLDRWPESAIPASAVERIPQKKNLFSWRWVGGLAAAAAMVFATWRVLLLSPAGADFDTSVTTQVGGLHMLQLPDGSIARLNTDSLVEVHYTATERRVHLVRGEALFAVAKNPARPFYVEAGGVSVRAVGTAFDVRLRATSVEVLVTEGKVRVENTARQGTLLPRIENAAEPPVLIAGQRMTVAVQPKASTLGNVATVPAIEIDRALAWQEKRLVFDAVPLDEVVAEFNRYNSHQLVIADPELGRQLFGGTFRADRFETLLSLLEQNFDVVREEQGHATVLRRRGK